MVIIARGLSLALLLSGCLGQVALASPAGKDVCWEKSTKRAFKKNVGSMIDALNASTKGHLLSADDAASSPRVIKAEDFSLLGVDSNTGNATCNATITITFKTRNHGTIVIPQEVINFSIVQSEHGGDVELKGEDFEGYKRDYIEKIKEISTDADVE